MDGTTITLTLEFRLEGDAPTGRATDSTGATREFSGWVGLVAAIDALVPGSPSPALRCRECDPFPTT